MDDVGEGDIGGVGGRRRIGVRLAAAPPAATPTAPPPLAWPFLVRRLLLLLGFLRGHRFIGLRHCHAVPVGGLAPPRPPPPPPLAGLLGGRRVVVGLLFVLRRVGYRLVFLRRCRLGGRRRSRLVAFEPEIGRDETVIAKKHDAQLVAPFDVVQGLALLVEDIEGDGDRHVDDQRLGAVPPAFLFDGAEHMQRRRLRGTPRSRASAMGADLEAGLEEAWMQPLAGQLEQAERADAAQLDARAVVAHCVLELAFDLGVVARDFHVDEVDDDEAGKVAQPQLAGDFGGRLEVGLERRLLDVALARRPPRVHVDGDQRLGGVDHDVATGLELDHRAVHGVELAFHLIALKQWQDRIEVLLDLLCVAGDEHLHEVFGAAVALLALDHDFLDVAAVQIANGALDQVGLLVHQGGGGRFQGEFPHAVPQAQQVAVVALDFRLVAFGAGGAHDHPEAGRDVEFVHQRLETLAVRRVRYFSGNATAARRIGHKHAIAPGQGDIGGQGRALVAPFLLDHLNEQDLPPLDDLLDPVAALRSVGAAHLDLFDVVATDSLEAL